MMVCNGLMVSTTNNQPKLEENEMKKAKTEYKVKDLRTRGLITTTVNFLKWNNENLEWLPHHKTGKTYFVIK